MKLLRGLFVLGLAASLLVGQPASAADERPLVVGTGDRVSGRLDVVWVGPADAEFPAAVERLARDVAPPGLTIRVERRAALTDCAPDVPLLAAAWPVDAETKTADALRAYAARGRGLLVLVGTVTAKVPGLTEGLLEARRFGALHAIDPQGDRRWGDDPKLAAFAGDDRVFRVVAAPSDAPQDALALSTVRHALVRAGGVRYLETVFGTLTLRPSSQRTFELDAPTLAEGRVTMDILTVEGLTLVPPGRVYPFALPVDQEGALLRLRFEGGGASDEVRYWLPDLLPGRIGAARVEGMRRLTADAPAVFRVRADTPEGLPLAGCRVSARLGADRAESITDATGTAALAFAPQTVGDEPARELMVYLDNRIDHCTMRADVQVHASEGACLVETSRRAYRPGGLLLVRAMVLAPNGRPAEGREVAVRVTDSRDRVLREFAGRTGAFGAAVFEMPLAEGIVEGPYTARVTAGRLGSSCTFLVEDSERAPFDAAITLAERRVERGATVRGTVTAAEWDGAPLEGATVRVTLGAETRVLALDSATRFEILAPREGDPATVLRVVAEHRGRVVTSETELEITRPGEPALDVPARIREGAALPVEVRGVEKGVVDVELVGRGRLLVAGSAAVVDGRASVVLGVPVRSAGAATLRVTARSGELRNLVRPVEIEPGDELSVVLDVPRAVAPGADVTAHVRVLDAEGRVVPALLDARCEDRAHEAAAPLPAAVFDWDGDAWITTLASYSADTVWEELEKRIDEASLPALRAATRAVVAGRKPDVPFPWGAPVVVRTYGVPYVLGRHAVTARPRGFGDGPPQPLFAVLQDTPAPAPRIELLPADERPERTGIRREFLASHQSPDGAWRAAGFLEQCVGGSCGDPGKPHFDVATTGLALLCFLGAGETHQAGPYKDVLKRGFAWLRARQVADGSFADRGAPCAEFSHALAANAMVESFGMTQSKIWQDPAQRALDHVVASQRPDGGFCEPGETQGGVVLGTLCAMLLKSGTMAGLRVDESVLPRYIAWLDAHADAATGAPAPTAREIADYPFHPDAASRLAAAGGFLARTYAGLDARTPAMQRAIATLAAAPPRHDADDYGRGDWFSTWLGTLAAFQAKGQCWTIWNASLKANLIDHQRRALELCSFGSWDPWPPEDARGGRLFATCTACLTMEVFYRYPRVFGEDPQAPAREPARVRREFPDLCVERLAVPTDARGDSALRFRVPDQITTWDLAVGAWDAEGRHGRGTATIVPSLPLHATLRMPQRLRRGDVLNVPITVRSSLDADTSCEVEVLAADGLIVPSPPEKTLRVAPGQVAATTLRCIVGDAARVTLRIGVSGAGKSDAVEASAEVVTAEREFAWSRRVRAGETVKAPVGEKSCARAVLRVRSGASVIADESLTALIRRPTGCFEQTTSTLWPALLAWRRLGAPKDDARIGYLREGAQRLLSFEAPGGGFGMFPGQPSRTAATALAVHLMLDLGGIVPTDPAVLERAGSFLAAGLPEEPAARTFALSALRRLGRAVDARPPDPAGDPYLLALALSEGLLDGVAADRATAELAGLAVRVPGSAVWRTKSVGLFNGAPASEVEVTALAVRALTARSEHAALVEDGVETLRGSLREDGAWATTRETVAALQALVAVSETAATGTVSVDMPRRDRVTRPLGAAPLEIDLGPWTAADEMSLRFDGTGAPWATLCIRGTGEGPGGGEKSALELGVTWAQPLPWQSVGVVTVSVANVGARVIHAPIVVLPLPGCVEVDRQALARAASDAGFALAEVAGGTVRLYCSSLPAGERRSVAVPVIARHEGTFATGAATAYPYYQPDAAVWVSGVRVESPGLHVRGR